MEKIINSEAVRQALATVGWSQKRLANELGVSSQAVTNWLHGTDFPRPDKLLKLATTLSLRFEQLVASTARKPVVAFRKKGGTKTTEQHVLKAMAMGALLKPLVAFLPTQQAFRTQISSPSTAYDVVQNAASAIRQKIGIGMQAVLLYEHLIDQFRENDAVIIPVMWGDQKNHRNALHIFLPEENITFIYLNLDTHLEDFKFWMAHELAHVYSQELAGDDVGEDFADSLAGALLFPHELAKGAYSSAMAARDARGEIAPLHRLATDHKISLYSVYCEVRNFARANNLPHLRTTEQDIHAVRNNQRWPLVSETLFKPIPPAPSQYIAAAQHVFKTPFFAALQRMLREGNTGAGYVQQVLDVSMKDASAISAELMR